MLLFRKKARTIIIFSLLISSYSLYLIIINYNIKELIYYCYLLISSQRSLFSLMRVSCYLISIAIAFCKFPYYDLILVTSLNIKLLSVFSKSLSKLKLFPEGFLNYYPLSSLLFSNCYVENSSLNVFSPLFLLISDNIFLKKQYFILFKKMNSLLLSSLKQLIFVFRICSLVSHFMEVIHIQLFI